MADDDTKPASSELPDSPGDHKLTLGADNKLALVLDVPVDEVTLLEDRARVVRRAKVELSAGFSRVRIDGVAPVLSDKTLVGQILDSEKPEVAAAGTEVVDAQVLRRLVTDYDDPDRAPAPNEAALAAELRKQDAEIKALENTSALLDRQAGSIDKIAQLTYAELSEDVSFGRSIGEEWPARLDELQRSERELRERLVALAHDIEERKQARSRLQMRIESQRNPAERQWAAIEAVLSVERAGTYLLAFEYVVPGACWRPYHTARLIEEESPVARTGAGESGQKKPKSSSRKARLVFATDACVWQNTGEDWRNAALVLSTERASLGTEPPLLDNDILAVRRKSDEVVVETREQDIQTTGLGADAPAAREAASLPGIDDGGMTRNFRAPHRTSVPADGRPHRVALQSFESDAEIELLAMPELAECVLTKTEQANRGDGPILAGPVDLIRQSGLVGRTQVLFVAAGERFKLGWGPEPDLRLKRFTETTEEKSRLLSSWIERTHKVYIMLSNLGDRVHAISITERIPVSEIDKVKIQVDGDKTTGSQKPNENGFLVWQVDLAARGYERIQLQYQVKKHEDVRGL